MSQTQIRPVDFNPTSSPDITHTEANNNNNDHNNNVNNSNANNDIDKSIMKESSPKSTNLRKNPQIIHRTILLGKKVFEYKGPVNQEIMDLLDLIESNASTDYQGIFEWVKNPLNKLKEINEQVEQKFTCINGLVRVNLNDFLLQFVFWLMYAVACIRLKDFDDDFVLNKDGIMGSFLINGKVFLLGFILTIYSLFVTYIPKKRILLIISIFQVIIPLFILLNDFNLFTPSATINTDINYSEIILVIFLLASYFYGILFWIIRFSLKTRKNGEIFSVFFISIIHGVLFQGVAVPILLDLMTTKTNQYLSAAVNILTAPMIIFIILSWVFIHLKFFYFPLSTIEKNLKIISEGIKNGLYRSQTLNNLHSSVWWRLFNRKINIIASIITGTVYSYCEINLWLFIKDEAVKDSNINTTLLTITLALLILNPLFLMLGISIVVSPFRNSNKFLYTPLFCGALPMIGLLPLYSYISSYIELQELGKVIFFGFPSGVFFWMTLILTGIRRKHIFYSAITILCLFILLPFAYFAPLNEEKAFEQNEIIKVLIYVLGFMGVGLFAILLLVLIWIYVLKRFKENKLEKTNSFNLAVYIIANLKDCGFWFNAVFFMISFIALSYSIYYHPSSTSVISTGTLNGILVVVILLFLLMNVIIRMQKIPPLKNKSSANLSDEIIQKAENSASFQRTLDIRRKLLKTLIIFSIFFIPIVCVPLNFLISEKTVSSTFMTIAFGGPITFIIFAGLLYLKNRSGRYVNFITPVAVVLCWIFLFIPFCVLIPCFSAFLQNHTQDFASFLRLTIACSALLIMLGVTIFSIIMNVILKRFEFEKKLRFIVLKLKQALFNVAVRSDVLTCRRLYETFFLLDDEEGYRVQLIDGNPVNWLPVPREDPDLHYSKQLVTMEAFRVLKRKKAPIEKDVKAMGCFERCLRSLCCIKERKEDKVNLDLLQNALGNFQFDEELLLADDFLSHKFKHRNVELINEDDERQNLNLYKFLHDKQEQKEKEKGIEIQNLNNLIDDPNFLKNGKVLRESFKSPKTQAFEQISFATNPNEIQKIKYSEHGHGIRSSQFLLEDWLIHIFEYFSYIDPLAPSPIILYNDLYQMLRLGGVLSKTRDYDSEYNEESIITKDEFDFLNDLTSVIPLSAGFLATDLEGFGSFLIELSFLCFPVEKIEDSLSTLLHEFLYPNLMYLFPSIARNYKENIRAVLKPQQDHRGFELSGIITRFKQNNRNYSSNRTALETIKQDQEDNKRLFDLKFGDNMLGNENLQTMQSAFDKKKIKLLKTADQTTKIQSIYDSPLGKTINALDERRKAENLKKEEKLKRWEEKKKMLEIMRLKYEREAAQTYGFKGKILKIGFYCTKCCYLLTKFCKEGPSRLTGKISKGLKNLGKRLGFKDDEELMDGELEKLKVRKEAPSWQEIVDLMISTMVSAEKEYNAQMEKNLILHFNLSNILALFGKFSDLYTFANYSFQSGIPWFSETSSSASLLEGSGPLYSQYQILFWGSLGLSILYATLAVPATKQAKLGTLGMNSHTGEKAGFPHPQFFLTKGISLLGSTLFLLIMRTFIDAFVCSYPDTDYWYMLREGENECLSDLHILYMLFAFVGLGLYYPLSTFFFPNFQFQDKALDVKYNPSFVVLQMQAKLIIAGLGSLFSSYGDSDFPLILQVSSTATVLFFLAITSAKLKPCLIRKINLWDTGLYLLVGYMNSCALIVLLTYNSTIGIIALTVGGSLIILGTAIIHRKVYGPFNCFGKSNKVRNEEDEVEKEEEKLEEKKREEKEEKDKNEQKSKDEKNKDILADTEKEKKKNKNKSKEINGFGKNIIVKNPEAYRF